MAFEVDEEPLPVGWEIAMSRSKNKPYYHNAETKKVYWVDDELPRGWSHQFDNDGRVFYFHIKDKNGSVSYDKPQLRPAKSLKGDERTLSPEPMPLPEPSYDREDDLRFSESAPKPERKKSNSLMDLLSPGPPAQINAEDNAHDDPRVRSSSRGSMDISNLVSSSGNSSGNKRPFDQIAKEADPDAAAAFYNQLQRNATSDRADSMLFHMRAMNNWVKSILINEYSRRDDCVLDLACGKGGDLMKWAKRGISKYVGVDIAQKSLEDAVERIESNAQHRDLDVQFIQGDLGRVSLLEDESHCWTRSRGWHDAIPLESACCFNLISMQFSFHYMFGDEQRASRCFRTLHELLVDGGIFIATTVDPNKILMKYYQNLHSEDTEQDQQRQAGETKPDVQILDDKKREVCAIRFDQTVKDQLLGFDTTSSEGAFGLRYNFTLRDSNDQAGGQAVDLPEYLVPDDLLKRLLKENGFELLLQQNFHSFVHKHSDKNRSLLEKMHVMNYAGSISDAEWEVAGLYQVLAFKKAY